MFPLPAVTTIGRTAASPPPPATAWPARPWYRHRPGPLPRCTHRSTCSLWPLTSCLPIPVLVLLLTSQAKDIRPTLPSTHPLSSVDLVLIPSLRLLIRVGDRRKTRPELRSTGPPISPSATPISSKKKRLSLLPSKHPRLVLASLLSITSKLPFYFFYLPSVKVI